MSRRGRLGQIEVGKESVAPHLIPEIVHVGQGRHDRLEGILRVGQVGGHGVTGDRYPLPVGIRQQPLCLVEACCPAQSRQVFEGRLIRIDDGQERIPTTRVIGVSVGRIPDVVGEREAGDINQAIVIGRDIQGAILRAAAQV